VPDNLFECLSIKNSKAFISDLRAGSAVLVTRFIVIVLNSLKALGIGGAVGIVGEIG
jgi:hypothetical protein